MCSRKLVSDNDSELFIYDPFTIKGLEQDVAVLEDMLRAMKVSSHVIEHHHDAERDFQPGICLTVSIDTCWCPTAERETR